MLAETEALARFREALRRSCDCMSRVLGVGIIGVGDTSE